MGFDGNLGSFLIGLVNVGSSLIVIPLLVKFGRKTVMVVYSFIIAAALLGLGFAYNAYDNDPLNNTAKTLSVVLIIVYVFVFQMSYGPVVWIGMAEIMTDKALSVGVLINWGSTIILGLATPFLLKGISGGLFMMFGACCIVAGIFFIFLMKETKGLSLAEVAKLYSREVNTYNKLAK